MTQVKMPEPVAWQNTLKPSEIYADDDLEPVWKSCSTLNALITTTQAEAYADARVREALKELEATVMEMYNTAVKARIPPDEDEEGWNESCAYRAIALGEVVLAIRALISTDSRPGQP